MSIDTKALVENIQKTAQKNAIKKAKKIEKAIASSRLVLLSLHEFMNVTGIKMDNYLVNKFFHSIREDIPIYLDNELIKWCGYSGELRNQKENLMNLIKKYNIPLIKFDNNEYNEFRNNMLKLSCSGKTQNSCNNDTKKSNSDNELEDQKSESESESKSEYESEENEFDTELAEIYPEVDYSNGKGKTKHPMIMPDDFRMLVMRLPTKIGTLACCYYIEFEKLVKEYVNYQVQFLYRREELLEIELKESRDERRQDRIKYETDQKKAESGRIQLQNSFNNLAVDFKETVEVLEEDIQHLSEQLEHSTEDRVPKTTKESIREQFVLMRLNDEDPEVHEYYVIRSQIRSVRNAINRLRRICPNATRILTISCQPNAINLYNRIKEQLGELVVYEKNYISPVGLNHIQFIRRIRRINNDKRYVELEYDD